MNLLGEGKLGGERQRERHGNLSIDSDGGLPNLRHLEVVVYTSKVFGQRTLFRSDGGRSAKELTNLCYICNQTTLELVEHSIGSDGAVLI